MLTVGELRKMLACKRDEDIISINETLIEFARFNNEHGINKVTDLELFGGTELTKDEVRKARLRAVGVNVQ